MVGGCFPNFRSGVRLKLLLFGIFIFGLIYILILNNAVPTKSTINTYDLRPPAPDPISILTSSESNDSQITQPLSNPVDFDIGVLHFANLSEYTPLDESSKISNNLPLCPNITEITNYKKHLPQATLLIEDLQENEIQMVHKDIRLGGEWKPSHCKALHKVAIIIPYRDRKSHLNRLLDFLFPILQTQLLDFRFIVTEQYGEDLFNKGRIMNAAFRLAQKLGVDCVVFHDVDMFPQDDRTPYDCPNTPRHLGAFVSSLGYQLWYQEIVGGALSLRMFDYLAVNGYSNLYFGWGGEDDDMGKRILSQNLTIERPPDYARYSMLKHLKRKRTAPKLIYKLLDSASTRWINDGVNETGLWTVMSVQKMPLYYHILVDVGKSPEECDETMLFVDAAPSKAVREPTNLLHLDDREFILFQFWKSGTIAGMIGSMLIIALIGILYEAIAAFRVFISRNNDPTLVPDDVCPGSHGSNETADSRVGFIKVALHSITKQRIINSLLYAAEVTAFCLLILLICTFNVWIITSVICGRVVGHFLFNSSTQVTNTSMQAHGSSNLSVTYSTVSPRR